MSKKPLIFGGVSALLLAAMVKKKRPQFEIDFGEAILEDGVVENDVAQPTGQRKWGASSLRHLGTISPKLASIATRALELSPLDFSIVSGLRTQAEQDALFKAGKSKTRSSRHVTGLALDFALYRDGQIHFEPIEDFRTIWGAFQKAAGELGETLSWGGSFQDYGHVELIDHDPKNRKTFAFADYRRAKYSELPPEIVSLAKTFLNGGGLEGEYLDKGEFRLLLETHHNTPKGNHKGVSVLIRREDFA